MTSQRPHSRAEGKPTAKRMAKKSSSGSSSKKKTTRSAADETTRKAGASKKKAARKKAAKKAAAPAVSSEGSARPDDMPTDVMEFITAIDTYKREQERPFPNWSEILDILKSLGYRKSA